MSYTPPFTITSKTLNLVAEISESVGRLSETKEASQALHLRRVNRIRTIQGSLAIEGNTLSEAQITAVLEGKRVMAPPKEVQEVKNALAAYDAFERWKAHREKDLLEAHQRLMLGLVDELGVYRSGGVGVMNGSEVIHMAPPANQVPRLMADLLDWVQQAEYHPLIISSVFHYEFEFIHPFVDGNGRMGRLWQSLILAEWHELFANLPVENLVYRQQAEYYTALSQSTAQADSAPFIEFMLSMISQALKEQINTPQATPQAVLEIINKYPDLTQYATKPRSRQELQLFCGLNDREHFRKTVLKPLLLHGWLLLTLPDKPKSPKQRYVYKG